MQPPVHVTVLMATVGIPVEVSQKMFGCVTIGFWLHIDHM